MPSTYSSNLRIELIASGEQANTWGITTNNNLGTLLEQAISGEVTIAMADADVTLTALNGLSDQSRQMILNITGTNSTVRSVLAPQVNKVYVVTNNTTGGFAIDMKTTAGGSVALAIPNGYTATVWCDGTNFYCSHTSVAGNFIVSGNTSIGGNATISGNAGVTGNATVSGNLTVTGNSNIVPTGSLLMWSLATAPSGYLLCNGAAVSRTTYSNLFAVVGTTFGVGDGSTTFNLPDYRNNVPIGAGSTYSLGATGGAASTTLSTANLPAHNHTATVTDPGHAHGVNDPSHTHGVNGYINTNAGGAGDSYGTAHNEGGYINNAYTGISIATAGTGISVTTANTGSGTAFTNLPPYLAIYYIIKT